MIRNVLGSVVALAGAAAVVLSPFRDWYDGRPGHDYRVRDLFEGITTTSSAVMVSLFLPFLVVAVLAVAGVVLRSRLVVALAGVVALGFTVLWMVRQGQATGSLTVDPDGSGLQWGVVLALGGGLLLLIGSLVMSGRRRRRGRGPDAGAGTPDYDARTAPYPTPGYQHPDTWPPTQEPGPSTQTSTYPEPEPDPYTGPEDPRRHDGP
ncbi:hypothetical protein OG599_13955 [Streptomyces sp. NBC_01335]|uniref:hypothetical protein n=1 Tax=Streptomyces sp. NBC_01335 TaxID=2903828 RepID=UPI002E104B69|nr:hypothetical protein OG599_13955 [Streptomyces sp. NBC_01335]